MPPIIIGAITGGTGPRLDRLRHLLADELGYYLPTTVSEAATHGERERAILADELRDDEGGYPFLPDPWVYVVDGAQAGTQRRIMRQSGIGYQGPNGAVVLSRPFPAALAQGTAIEVTSPLPVKRHLGIKGLDDCLNEGLAAFETEVWLAVSGNGTREYGLDSEEWLVSTDQLRGVYDTTWLGASEPAQLSPSGSSIRVNGGERTLVLEQTYTSGQTFYQAAMVRADTLVYDGSAWGYAATPGLLGDAYRTAAPERWALAFGMVKALEYLLRLTDDAEMPDAARARRLATLDRRYRKWVRAANRLRLQAMSRPIARRTPSLLAGTASSNQDGWP